jgi:hypothetical protein
MTRVYLSALPFWPWQGCFLEVSFPGASQSSYNFFRCSAPDTYERAAFADPLQAASLGDSVSAFLFSY